MSRSFMMVMCYSRLAKLSVSADSFSCRDFSVFSEFLSCISKVLIVLDFSASISRRTWISDSISVFCLSSSSVISKSFFLLNSY